MGERLSRLTGQRVRGAGKTGAGGVRGEVVVPADVPLPLGPERSGVRTLS